MRQMQAVLQSVGVNTKKGESEYQSVKEGGEEKTVGVHYFCVQTVQAAE
jgi:hypothetical protein